MTCELKPGDRVRIKGTDKFGQIPGNYMVGTLAVAVDISSGHRFLVPIELVERIEPVTVTVAEPVKLPVTIESMSGAKFAVGSDSDSHYYPVVISAPLFGHRLFAAGDARKFAYGILTAIGDIPEARQ